MRAFTPKQIIFLCEQRALPVQFLWWKQTAIEAKSAFSIAVFAAAVALVLFTIGARSLNFEVFCICSILSAASGYVSYRTWQCHIAFRKDVGRPYALLLQYLGKQSGDIAQLDQSGLEALAKESLVLLANKIEQNQRVEANVPDHSARYAVAHAKDAFVIAKDTFLNFGIAADGGWANYLADDVTEETPPAMATSSG